MSKQDKDDAYSKLFEEQNKLADPTVETARARKWRILKNKAVQLKGAAYQGFIMGSLVGGGFGFIVGCWTAITSRSLLAIPISTIVSGASFGFIMGCGSMIRSDDQLIPIQQVIRFNNQVYTIEPLWKLKYQQQSN